MAKKDRKIKPDIESAENAAAMAADEEIKNMTREDCFKALGLPENSSDDAVKSRYGALLRQYKRKVDEYGTTYEDLAYYRKITGAYDRIFGYSHDYSDDNPTSVIPFRIRRKYGKFLTWFEQYRLVVILAAVIMLLAVVFTVQNCSKTKPDLKLKFVGPFRQSLDKNITEEINKKSSVLKNAQITFFTVDYGTALPFNLSAQNGAVSFMTQLMADGGLDVVIVNEAEYYDWVKSNSFLPLDGIYARYCETHGDTYLIDVYEYESEEGSKIEVEHAIYGIDISYTGFFDDTGLVFLDLEEGEQPSMIFCIARRAKNIETAEKFLTELLENSDYTVPGSGS